MHRDLPEFLAVDNSNLIFCDTLRWKRKYSCLALTRQLKFYEFSRKQMLHCVDLKDTCLRTIKCKLQAYQGPRMKSYIKHNMQQLQISSVSSVDAMNATNQTMNDDCSKTSTNKETTWAAYDQITSSKEIEFGKYAYRNNQLYVLLRCWDKLLVMKQQQRQEGVTTGTMAMSECYALVAEYEQVQSFRLVHDKITYQALVEITRTNGTIIKTDFQINNDDNNDNCQAPALAETTKSLLGNSEFKELIHHVNGLRSDLQMHCAMTMEDFENMRETQTFGNGNARSPLIDEKQLLTRFGDIWLRITAEDHDTLVLGIPLVNNSGINKSTIARNIRPLIQMTSDEQQHDDLELSSISFYHRFYQLHQYHHQQQQQQQHHLNVDQQDVTAASTHLSNTQDENLEALVWYAEQQEQQLLPECKAVLLIRLSLAQLVPYQEFKVFLTYEAANNDDDNKDYSKLQIFLNSFNIKDLLSQRDQFTTDFNNKLTLQQDFLAVIMTQAASCNLLLKYENNDLDYEQFCQVLMRHFQFDLWNSCLVDNDDSTSNNSTHNDDNEDVDMKSVNAKASQRITVYSNRQTTSLWHGTLMLCRRTNDKSGAFKWSIYARNKDKLGLLLSVLFQDLLKYKCNISNIELMASNWDWEPMTTANTSSREETRTLRLEDILRQELRAWHDYISAGEEDLKLSLYRTQLKCDLIAASAVRKA